MFLVLHHNTVEVQRDTDSYMQSLTYLFIALAHSSISVTLFSVVFSTCPMESAPLPSRAAILADTWCETPSQSMRRAIKAHYQALCAKITQRKQWNRSPYKCDFKNVFEMIQTSSFDKFWSFLNSSSFQTQLKYPQTLWFFPQMIN